MTTKAQTLADFLLARIAEDEAVAKAAGPHGRPLGGHWVSRRPDRPECHVYGDFGWLVEGPDVETHDSEWGKAVADHIARHDPARVLAECEAKRRIVELLEDERQRKDIYNRDFDRGLLETDGDFQSRHSANARWAGLEAAARALAMPYADHPDFREEWRP